MNALEQWQRRYKRAGIATIPIIPGTKRPVCEAWQHTPPARQWERAEGGNLAVLCGPSGVAVLDTDHPDTTTAALAVLDGLGYPAPAVRTPSGGMHFYLRVDKPPADFNWGRLLIGPGELRARRAYVVAPPSRYDGRLYRWQRGMPEALFTLPPIRWAELSPLVAPAPARIELEAPPVRLPWGPMPGKAADLFTILRDAPDGPVSLTTPAGRITRQYASRSESEAAIVAVLILAGWSYGEIRTAFTDWLPAHYRHAGRGRPRYFERTYRAVLAELASTPERTQAAEWWQAAEIAAWPGVTGASDRLTYLALVAAAWKWSTDTPQASRRWLSEHTGMRQGTITGALGRLHQAGQIQPLAARTKPTDGDSYRIRGYYPHTPGESAPAPPHPLNTVTIDPIQAHPPAVADLFSPACLGRAAGMVYACLSTTPRRVPGLMQQTGKGRRTVYRALSRLAEYRLAVKGADGWIIGPAKLADVIAVFDGCERRARDRRERHDREREIWREMVNT